MSTSQAEAPSNYAATLDTIKSWPVPYRLALLSDIARALMAEEEETATTPRKKHGLERARGLLVSDQPPPTDQEVAQWLEDARMEKYG